MNMARTAFYNTVLDFWPDLYGEAYALYDTLAITMKKKEELLLAAKRSGRIFFKTASLLRQLDDETLLLMNYPKESLPFLRLCSSVSESVISRLDFAEHNGRFKVMELNADTPTFIKELYSVNQAVCEHFHVPDVNDGEEERLKLAVQAAVWQAREECGIEQVYLVFTSHGDHIEDRLTSVYLQQLCEVPSRFVPLEKLQIVEGEGLYDDEGRRIHILYRQTFPIECLLLDKDETGAPIGEMLLSLVKENKLKLINPPSAFLLQNKAVQAIIWGLHEENNPFFTEEEHRWIRAYFLPTYLEEDVFLEKRMPYVRKPVFGREGDTVEIYDGTGEKMAEDTQKSYASYGFVYQQLVSLSKAHVEVSGEKKELHTMYGCFLLNGEASAIGCRAGGRITNNTSYYLPLCIEQ